MQTEPKQSNNKKYWIIGVVAFAILLLVVLTIANFNAVTGGIHFILGLFRAVLIGLALAYLCNPIFRLLEQRVFVGIRNQGLRRTFSMICTYLTVILILLAILLLVIPGLIQSIGSFTENYEVYLSSALNHINSIIDKINALIGKVIDQQHFFGKLDENKLSTFFAELLQGNEETGKPGLLDQLSTENLMGIVSSVGSAFSVITDSVLGVFVSIYLLMDKEKLHAQLMKLRTAIFSDRGNAAITRVCKTADRCFGRFLRGKLLDSMLVGVLIYISLLIANVPYAILLATIIAICNIIPIIGPLIGAVPCAVIVILTAPNKALIFVLIALIVQQIDSNIIAPKIVGANIGISSLCVMIAFTTMTALLGLWGAVLGVPIFATILELLDHTAIGCLKKKGLPTDVESYYAQGAIMDPIDDAKASTRRLQRNVENHVLSALKTLDDQGDKALTRKDRRYLRFYQWAKKRKLMPNITDETYMEASIRGAYDDGIAANRAYTVGEEGEA